jgi:hypothetical protein
VALRPHNTGNDTNQATSVPDAPRFAESASLIALE